MGLELSFTIFISLANVEKHFGINSTDKSKFWSIVCSLTKLPADKER